MNGCHGMLVCLSVMCFIVMVVLVAVGGAQYGTGHPKSLRYKETVCSVTDSTYDIVSSCPGYTGCFKPKWTVQYNTESDDRQISSTIVGKVVSHLYVIGHHPADHYVSIQILFFAVTNI
jgi:hypothetical protein